MKNAVINVGGVKFSNAIPAAFIAGPCVIESEELLYKTGKTLKELCAKQKRGFVLKASFDKANRTSIKAFRGPGMQEGLGIVARVKEKLGVPVVIDVHEAGQASEVAEVADMLQVPAFLCRQTDLLVACAKTGKPVNVKKGQFLSPWDVKNIAAKLEAAGNKNILFTERGTTFGYGNLVVDMRSLAIMKETGYPVIFDCTHSVQKPGGLGTATGGDAVYAPVLARAAAAVGVAGVFFEAHPNPAKALSDGPNSIRLNEASKLVKIISEFDSLAKRTIK